MCSIYFLDITIFSLCVDERIVRDAEGDTDFAVTIDLMDVPSLIVRRTKPIDDVRGPDDHWTNLVYNSGVACHFVAKGSTIASLAKLKPPIIGVYRVGERFPVCHGVVPFTGCVCDTVSESIGNSRPYEFGGTFDLVDTGNDPAGNIVLKLVLRDLGRYVVTFYALDRDAFVLKNDSEGVEYRCVALKNSVIIDADDAPTTIGDCCSTKSASENLMPDIAGISLGAWNLSLGKLEAKRVVVPIDDLAEVSDGIEEKIGKAGGKKKSKKKSSKKTKGR